MSEPCIACAGAQTDPRHPFFHGDCRGCRVRSLAGGLEHFEAQRAGRITPGYRAALVRLLGEDWQAGHAEVKAERARLQRLKEARPW